jgi:hypothetical protein
MSALLCWVSEALAVNRALRAVPRAEFVASSLPVLNPRVSIVYRLLLCQKHRFNFGAFKDVPRARYSLIWIIVASELK